MEITQEIAVRILKSRKIVNKPCKVTTKVTAVTRYQPEEGDTRYIVNTTLMNIFGANKAKQALSAGEYQEATNTNLSFTVFEGEDGKPNGWLPQKGEIINAFVDNIQLKSGETALLISSISEMAISNESVSFDFGFDENEVKQAESAFTAEKAI